MTCKLLVVHPDQCTEVQFDQQITIGRDVFNSLSLQDPELSRSHAIIFEQDQEVIIKDLKSRNGVYVGGERISEKLLQPGDEIILGSSILIFSPPEELDLGTALSKRGKYLLEKRANRPTLKPRQEPATTFSPQEMDEAIDALFIKPDGSTFFSLQNAIALLQAIKAMNGAADPAELFAVTLRRALAIVGGHRGVIMESDTDKKQLKVRSIFSKDNSETILIGQPVLRLVLQAEKCVYCPNVLRDERFEKVASKSRTPIHGFIAAPLKLNDELFGFIYLDAEDDSVGYDYAAMRSLWFIASHLAALLFQRPTHFAHTTGKHLAAGAGAE